MKTDHVRICVLLATIFVLTACGGGGGGGGGGGAGAGGSGGGGGTSTSDTTPPAVSSTKPANATDDADPDALIEGVFSEDLFASTVNGSSFTLKRADDDAVVSGTVSYDALTRTARFAPVSSLGLRRIYTATINTAITDLAGNPLSSLYDWVFRTRDGMWKTAVPIETNDAGDADFPQIAADPAGNATAVWRQYDGAGWAIYANRYVPGTGWGTAQAIQAGNARDAQPQVAVDAAGNAVAVWIQLDGTRNDVWANRYVPGTGWGAATRIQIGNVASVPQIAVNASGTAVAVWHQFFTGGTWNICANHYVPGAGWGTTTSFPDNSALGPNDFPQVAVDAGGNATVVWHHYDGARWAIWANRYAPGAGWGTAAPIETHPGSLANAFNPQVAVDAAGNSIAVWKQATTTLMPPLTGTYDDIWANRYAPGAGWGTPTLIEVDDSGAASDPQIAVNAAGRAVAVWHQHDGTRTNIWANQFGPASGWGAATLIETDNMGGALYPQVAVDAAGNTFAVWRQYDGSRWAIWTNRYLAGMPAGGNWGAAAPINTGTGYDPQIAVDAAGRAISVWRQFDSPGRWNIWAARFE